MDLIESSVQFPPIPIFLENELSQCIPDPDSNDAAAELQTLTVTTTNFAGMDGGLAVPIVPAFPVAKSSGTFPVASGSSKRKSRNPAPNAVQKPTLVLVGYGEENGDKKIGGRSRTATMKAAQGTEIPSTYRKARKRQSGLPMYLMSTEDFEDSEMQRRIFRAKSAKEFRNRMKSEMVNLKKENAKLQKKNALLKGTLAEIVTMFRSVDWES